MDLTLFDLGSYHIHLLFIEIAYGGTWHWRWHIALTLKLKIVAPIILLQKEKLELAKFVTYSCPSLSLQCNNSFTFHHSERSASFETHLIWVTFFLHFKMVRF